MKMFYKRVPGAALGLLLVLGVNASWAHGDAKPRHGGIVQTVNDVTVELVAQPGAAWVYVADHGKPVAPAGMGGKLAVLRGSEKTEYPLTVAQDRLEAPGAALGRGAKVVVVLTAAGQKTITARFSIK